MHPLIFIVIYNLCANLISINLILFEEIFKL